ACGPPGNTAPTVTLTRPSGFTTCSARRSILAGAEKVVKTDGLVNVTVGAVFPGGPHASIARPRFRRPPVIVTPDRAGIGSTLVNSSDFTVAVLAVQRERSSAAAPDTCGVAIEVPLKYL